MVLTFSLQIHVIVRGNMKIKHLGSIPGYGMGCVLVCKSILLLVPVFDPSSFYLLLQVYLLPLQQIEVYHLLHLWTSAQPQSSCAASFKGRSKSSSENLHLAIPSQWRYLNSEELGFIYLRQTPLTVRGEETGTYRAPSIHLGHTFVSDFLLFSELHLFRSALFLGFFTPPICFTCLFCLVDLDLGLLS